MPYGNKGFDFICGKGYKVDVKCRSVGIHRKKYRCWYFKINQNMIADYFALVAIDDRDSLTPLHFWIIPGCVINMKKNLRIYESNLKRWDIYEKSRDELISCCNTFHERFDGVVVLS
jgi:hypothetical protein